MNEHAQKVEDRGPQAGPAAGETPAARTAAVSTAAAGVSSSPVTRHPSPFTSEAGGIAVEGLGIHAGSFSLSGLSFEIPGGEYAVLMGKTGSGKTTILETLCGLRRASAGRIKLAGRDVTGLRPADRGIGYVPQDRALFRTMTVREHLAFSLVVRKWKDDLVAQRVAELSAWLGLEKLLERRPEGLSGGEAQRVALGRALASRPLLLLLDEPLSALDDETRQETYAVLRSVRAQTGVTVLHVTHSRSEFEALGTRLLLLENGSVRECKLNT